jgi:tetratricopeptide (TPR) repeat protein
LTLATGCRPKPPAADFGSPRAALLTVAGELRRFEARDFYRQPFPVDLSGVNAFSAALVRLENFESLHPGVQTDVVEFLRGEALLCLRDYRAANDAFERAARLESELRPRAQERRALALSLEEKASFPPSQESVNESLELLDNRRAELRAFAQAVQGRPAKTLALLEAEQADVDWARAITQTRSLRAAGIEEAVDAWREVIGSHPESYLRMRHRLALAGLFEDLAEEYLEANSPSTLRFVREDFLRLADAARSVYWEIAGADGFPEKLVARARLEAMNQLVEEALRHRP